MIQLITPKGR